MQTKDQTGIHVEGHIKIFDPVSKEIFVNKRNAIHYENISYALAASLSNNTDGGYIYQMNFGNGGTSIDPTGIITYLTPNTGGTNASLYNQTYNKVIDPTASTNTDPTRNFTEVRHVTGVNYTDIFCTCLLDYGEPGGQSAYDTSSTGETTYVFDELGLQSYSASGNSLLLTHVIFHPVLKSLNRLIQIDYTVRIQSLTGLVGV
jgi:hypothetical protein